MYKVASPTRVEQVCEAAPAFPRSLHHPGFCWAGREAALGLTMAQQALTPDSGRTEPQLESVLGLQ